MTTKLSTKVFENPNIMDKILNEIDGGLTRSLHVRLISKLFNESCIEKLRKSHLALKIEYIGDQFSNRIDHEPIIERAQEVEILQDLFRLGAWPVRDEPGDDVMGRAEIQEIPLQGHLGWSEEHDILLFINYKRVDVNCIGGYLRFLRDINVKVEKITLSNIWKLERPYQKSIHDAITDTLLPMRYEQIRSFIGMNEICARCDRCDVIASACSVNRSIRQVMCSTTSKFYEKLIIMESTLDDYANRIYEYNLEGVTHRHDDHISRNIKCDTIELRISEALYLKDGRNKQEFDHPPLPREVIELMVERWEVKNIVLKFCKEVKCSLYKARWMERGFLSQFKFNDSFQSIEPRDTKPKIENVTLDLTQSENCSKGLIESNSNAISVIKRLFSTNHISILFSHWSHPCQTKIDIVLENLLKSIFQEDQKNLRVDICYYGKMEQFAYFDNKMKLIEVAFPIRLKQHRVHLTSGTRRLEKKKYSLIEKEFVNEKWVGRRLKLEDRKNGCIINWAVLINENDRLDGISKYLIREHPNCLVKYFIDC